MFIVFSSLFLYFVVRVRRRRKMFTFAISSADEFLVCIVVDMIVMRVLYIVLC